MRDIILLSIVAAAAPAMVMRPYIGVYFWTIFAFVNPHRFSWGFAYNFPFAQVIALCTVVGLIFSKEPKRIPWTPVTISLVIFILWMGVTTLFSLHPDVAWQQYIKILKIQFMTFVILILINDQKKLNRLVWVIVLSMGFFGVKGGIFAILTKGHYMVTGPEGSFISGNTEMGLALIITLPLIFYLQQTVENKWIRVGLLIVAGLSALAIIVTYSRGALLGIAAMSGFLWLKSQKKLITGLIILLFIPIVISFMPDKWFDRMETIQTYEQDASAMGRIVAWKHAYNVATQRFTGGGYGCFEVEDYEKFSPNLELVLGSNVVAHSIYFQLLAHHGFIGLSIFLILGLFSWRTATWVIKNTSGYDKLVWVSNLTRMVQVSIVGYAVSGAFLSLAYFDLIYMLVAILVIAKKLVEEEIKEKSGNENNSTEISNYGIVKNGS